MLSSLFHPSLRLTITAECQWGPSSDTREGFQVVISRPNDERESGRPNEDQTNSLQVDISVGDGTVIKGMAQGVGDTVVGGRRSFRIPLSKGVVRTTIMG
jgi:hypothetical protein